MSSSAASCISCKQPLVARDAPFCTVCGSPQSKECVNVRCKTQLPVVAGFCFNCGRSQPRPQEQDMKWCINCKEKLKPSDDDICLKCKKTSESQKSRCIFCERPLSLDGNNCCKFCTASQDIKELKKRSFKECHQCHRQLFYESGLCVSETCNAIQTSLPDEQSHAPATTPDIGHSRNDQLNQDPPPLPLNRPPDLSLPTDPPSHTKEQLAEMFKLFTPQKTNSDDVPVEEKRAGINPSSYANDREDNKSLDASSKKARAISEAAKDSGAVLHEKVGPTFGIKGETTANMSTNDSIGSSMSIGSSCHMPTRKRKQPDQDQDILEPPDPKKPETVCEDVTAVHKELDKIAQKIEKFREEDLKMSTDHLVKQPIANNDKEIVLKTKECDKNESVTYPPKSDLDVSKNSIEIKNSNAVIPQKPDVSGASYIAEASDSETDSSPRSTHQTEKETLSTTTTHATLSQDSSTPDHPLLVNDDKDFASPQPSDNTKIPSYEKDPPGTDKNAESGNERKNEADAQKGKSKKSGKEEKGRGSGDKSVEKGKNNQASDASKKTVKDKKTNIVPIT